MAEDSKLEILIRTIADVKGIELTKEEIEDLKRKTSDLGAGGADDLDESLRKAEGSGAALGTSLAGVLSALGAGVVAGGALNSAISKIADEVDALTEKNLAAGWDLDETKAKVAALRQAIKDSGDSAKAAARLATEAEDARRTAIQRSAEAEKERRGVINQIQGLVKSAFDIEDRSVDLAESKANLLKLQAEQQRKITEELRQQEQTDATYALDDEISRARYRLQFGKEAGDQLQAEIELRAEAVKLAQATGLAEETILEKLRERDAILAASVAKETTILDLIKVQDTARAAQQAAIEALRTAPDAQAIQAQRRAAIDRGRAGDKTGFQEAEKLSLAGASLASGDTAGAQALLAQAASLIAAERQKLSDAATQIASSAGASAAASAAIIQAANDANAKVLENFPTIGKRIAALGDTVSAQNASLADSIGTTASAVSAVSTRIDQLAAVVSRLARK